MDEKIFRKKSLERVSSPDQLDIYIKAANPKMWMLLAAIILFLVGTLVWAVFGKIETKVTAGVYVQDGIACALVSEANVGRITDSLLVRIDGQEFSCLAATAGPYMTASVQEMDEVTAKYLLHVTGIEDEEWFFILKFEAEGMPDGQYKGELVLEEISPVKFLIN